MMQAPKVGFCALVLLQALAESSLAEDETSVVSCRSSEDSDALLHGKACYSYLQQTHMVGVSGGTEEEHSNNFESNPTFLGAGDELEPMRQVSVDSFKVRMSHTYRNINELALAQTKKVEGVALIVPGLGEEERAEIVKHNIEWLKRQGVPFECTIYVYRDESSFPLNSIDFKPCELIRHNGFWMDHLLAYPLNKTMKGYVVHLLDGVRLGQQVDLRDMLTVMEENELVHAAVAFPIGEKRVRTFMRQRKECGIGRVVDLIELQFDIFTRNNFACLQDLIDTDNSLGWGVAQVLPTMCGGKLGIIDEMLAQKVYSGSYHRVEAKKEYAAYMMKYPGIEPPKGETLGLLAHGHRDPTTFSHPSSNDCFLRRVVAGTEVLLGGGLPRHS